MIKFQSLILESLRQRFRYERLKYMNSVLNMKIDYEDWFSFYDTEKFKDFIKNKYDVFSFQHPTQRNCASFIIRVNKIFYILNLILSKDHIEPYFGIIEDLNSFHFSTIDYYTSPKDRSTSVMAVNRIFSVIKDFMKKKNIRLLTFIGSDSVKRKKEGRKFSAKEKLYINAVTDIFNDIEVLKSMKPKIRIVKF